MNYQALGITHDPSSTLNKLQSNFKQRLLEEEKEFDISDEVEDDIEGKEQIKQLFHVIKIFFFSPFSFFSFVSFSFQLFIF